MSDHEPSLPEHDEDEPQGCPRCDSPERDRDGTHRTYDCMSRWDFDDPEGDYSNDACEIIAELRQHLADARADVKTAVANLEAAVQADRQRIEKALLQRSELAAREAAKHRGAADLLKIVAYDAGSGRLS